MGLTFVDLPFHSLHASRLLDDVVDELGGFLIPHLVFADSSLGQQVPQVRVQVVGVKADMRDVSDGKQKGVVRRQEPPSSLPGAKVKELQHLLESTGGPDVRFRQFGGLFLIFLVLLSFAAQD